MFDNLNNNNQPASSSNNQGVQPPKSVEDIFADTEQQAMVKPDVFKPKSSTPIQSEYVEVESSSVFKKILIIIGGIVFLGLLGYGGYSGYNKFFMAYEEQDVIVDQDQGDVFPGEENNIEENVSGVVPDEKIEEVIEESLLVQSQDSDQDGLTDEEEKFLGTDINNIDSDNDGLFDREEVKVYKTDPLKEDTDGDGYLDGAEVKGGYNPNGPGKLYELK